MRISMFTALAFAAVVGVSEPAAAAALPVGPAAPGAVELVQHHYRFRPRHHHYGR
ncbi:hypothetical protein [Methylobacterium brachythecii]|uniref:Uncharacterized protein n=1 Tax=Methylobacterium brachythecii TaxID=1176177 RepID=A0A7W6ARX5_9HYPH|nr:hypothetical protein [Methylobacterium brachythecii]MBB3905521.1 hypothetical protein [Methylobacterium brachythecii]